MSFSATNRTLSILNIFQAQVSTQAAPRLMQDLLGSLQQAIHEIQNTINTVSVKQFHSKIKICACQLAKSIPNIVTLVKSPQNAALKDVSDFLIGKIRWCLLEVLRLTDGGSDDDNEPSGIFVKLMYNVVLELRRETFCFTGLKTDIDEVLCQALTIAKLSNQEDYEEISASCKQVIATFAEFPDLPETSESALTTNALLSSLELLERRVNVAILRLFLHLASDPSYPLKQLTLKCTEKRHSARDCHQISEELDMLDLHCERIQLLGNFAVACSDDLPLNVKIRSCLASIDYCENFLRPTIADLYTIPSDYRKMEFLKFLVDEYQKEIKELTHLIDCVVDTETFVQVALCDISRLSQDIEQNLKNNMLNKRDAEVFLIRSIRLVKHLRLVATNTSHHTDLAGAIQKLELAVKQYQVRLRSCEFREGVLIQINAVLNAADKISDLLANNQSTYGAPLTDTLSCLETTEAGTSAHSTEDDVLQPYFAQVQSTPRTRLSFYSITPKKTPKYFPRRVSRPVDYVSGS